LKKIIKMLPTIKEIHTARAGTCWNILCCPLVSTIGNLWRSIRIYLLPCVGVLWFRCINCLWGCFCCCFRWPYEDKTFIGATALGDHEGKQTGREMEADTDWVRAKDLKGISGKRPQLFEGEIEPGDLCQGAVGDCWLVAAIASTAEFPDAIRRLFATAEYNPRGLYKVRIFDPIQKKFVIVMVDDRIPCKKGTTTPRFMSPNGNELWAIILEKAYAKFCGSYAALDGGFVLWGWHSFTGDHVFQMSKDAEKHSWYREDMVALEDKKDKRACGFRRTKEEFLDDQVWTLLKKYDKQKSLMSASIGKMDYRKTDGPSGEQMLEREGLVAGHAYSVIQAREVKNGMTGPTFKLLQLRNPWGTYEWKGNWSDKSTLWKKHPGIKKKVKFVDADDGAFWISFDDFKRVYTRVNVCDRNTTKDASLDVREDNGACGIVVGFCCGCTKFWILCHGLRNLYGHRSTDETRGTKEGWFAS